MKNKKIYNIRVIIISLISLFNYLPANSSTYECISLGETCTTAAALERFGLRNAAYPFDWTISSYSSLCNLFEQDFEDFLDPYYLTIRYDNRGIINKYGLVFVHDFPTIYYAENIEQKDLVVENELHPNWMKSLPEVQKKYVRRIQRLRDTCNSNKKVFFMRHKGVHSREEACTLRDTLKASYPHLDFILIVVANNPSFDTQWNEERIKNYRLDDTLIWNDVAQWKKIFVDLNLLP